MATFVVVKLLPIDILGFPALRQFYFYFVVGYLLNLWNEKISEKFRSWWPDLCIIAFLLLVPHWRREDSSMRFDPYLSAHLPMLAGKLGEYYNYAVALLGIGTAAQIVKGVTYSSATVKYLVFIGRRSIDIYAVHLKILPVCCVGLLLQNDVVFWRLILAAVLVVGLSLLVSHLIVRRSKSLRYMFLGGR